MADETEVTSYVLTGDASSLESALKAVATLAASTEKQLADLNKGFKEASRLAQRERASTSRALTQETRQHHLLAEAARKQWDDQRTAARARQLMAKEEAKAQRQVEALLRRFSKSSDKTAADLLKLERLSEQWGDALDGVAVDMARALGESKKLDQLTRESANAGRSLSMLKDEMQEAVLKATGLSESIGRYQNGIVGMIENNKKLAISLGIAAGVAGAALYATKAFYDLSESTQVAVVEMDRVAKASGITVQQLSSYTVAATRYGFELEEFADIHGNIAEKMTRARDAGSEEAITFKALGIEVTDASGRLRDVGDVFLDLTDRISRSTNVTEQLAVAQEFLGEDSAKKVLAALVEEEGAFRSAAAEAKALGLVVSDDLVEAARRNKAATDQLTLAWQAFKQEAGATEFWASLKERIAFALAPDGKVLAGIRQYANGAQDTVYLVRDHLRESAGDFQKRAQQVRAEIDAFNASQQKLKGSTGDVSAEVARLKAEMEAAKAASQGYDGATKDLDRAMGDLARSHAQAQKEMERQGEAMARQNEIMAELEKSLGKEAPAVDVGGVDFEALSDEVSSFSDDMIEDLKRAAEEAGTIGAKLERSIGIASQAWEEHGAAAMTTMRFIADASSYLANTLIKDQRKAARAQFAIDKVRAAATAGMNTAQAITAALTIPPPVGFALAGVAGALGAAQVAAIIAAQPKFHTGGYVRGAVGADGRANIPATLAPGETVLTQAGTAEIIRAMERGAGGRQQIVVTAYDGRTVSRALADPYTRGGRIQSVLRRSTITGIRS